MNANVYIFFALKKTCASMEGLNLKKILNPKKKELFNQVQLKTSSWQDHCSPSDMLPYCRQSTHSVDQFMEKMA